jgi:hypothetical protein
MATQNYPDPYMKMSVTYKSKKPSGWVDEVKNLWYVITTFAIGFMVATPILALLTIIFLK